MKDTYLIEVQSSIQTVLKGLNAADRLTYKGIALQSTKALGTKDNL